VFYLFQQEIEGGVGGSVFSNMIFGEWPATLGDIR
jgi:hypothetical protein